MSALCVMILGGWDKVFLFCFDACYGICTIVGPVLWKKQLDLWCLMDSPTPREVFFVKDWGPDMGFLGM